MTSSRYRQEPPAPSRSRRRAQAVRLAAVVGALLAIAACSNVNANVEFPGAWWAYDGSGSVIEVYEDGSAALVDVPVPAAGEACEVAGAMPYSGPATWEFVRSGVMRVFVNGTSFDALAEKQYGSQSWDFILIEYCGPDTVGPLPRYWGGFSDPVE